jgi:hypothetical protein
MFFKFVFAAYIAALFVLTVIALPNDDGRASASDAERAALEHVDDGTVQPARIEDDEWEVDVLRPDGSLVEVTFDYDLELRDLDEELGPGGTLAEDEIRGPLRRRAIRKALAITGSGDVPSVERDPGGEIEVNVRRRNGPRTEQIEVELDSKLRVGEVEPEDPGDE